MRENIAFPPILNEKRRFKWDIFVKTADQIVRNEQQKAKKTQEMRKTNSFSPPSSCKVLSDSFLWPGKPQKNERRALTPPPPGAALLSSHGCRLPIFRKYLRVSRQLYPNVKESTFGVFGIFIYA